MPILYENLTYKDILHHKVAYEHFDNAGKRLFEDWDIIGFEKAVLGCGENRYMCMAEQIKREHNIFGKLNQEMPFLRFKESGQHYGYELFLTPPRFWGSRGAPLWWAYAAREFTFDKLPMDEEELFNKYISVAKAFDINMRYNNTYYIERFAAGGMSSGIVMGEFVRKGWYTIRNRNRLYFEDSKPKDIVYLERAKERILWYCNKYIKGGYDVVERLDEADFLFAVMDSDCSQNQKEVSLLLWGVYTGKPLKVKEVAEIKGVTYNCIRQLERNFLRHLLSNKNSDMLISN